jgi:cold shock CspA family protein
LGFIKPNGGDDSLFIHKEALSNQKCKPQVNDIKPFSILKYQQVTKKA